ncbi:hypothetical protein BH11BAC7_BH11BAC7_37090 [soil metagenome]
MQCNSADILSLLEKAAAIAGYKPVNVYFPFIHAKMKEKIKGDFFAENYLYKKLYLRARNAEKNGGGKLNLKDEYIELIVSYAGFKSYDQFLKLREQKFPEELENCAGAWYSYVRCNSGEMYVLRAPVRIYEETKQIFIEMKGTSRTFKGELKIEAQCIHCLLESGQGKSIHLVLTLGVAKKPNVLLGVFSGISSGGDPIAGREVLVRQVLEFEGLKNNRLSISGLIGSDNEEEKLIGEYFMDKQDNILKGGRSSTFELGDLKK